MHSYRLSPLLRRGFTLLELLVVVLIVGTMAVLIVPGMVGQIEDAKRAKVLRDATTLYQAVCAYRLRCSQWQLSRDFPDNLRDLLDGPPEWDEAACGPWVPLLQTRDIMYDPWGGEYCLTVLNPQRGEFEIRSFGKDKQPGGDGAYQDVVYLPEHKKK